MSLDYLLYQLVLIKENKTQVLIAQMVVGPSKEMEQIKIKKASQLLV